MKNVPRIVNEERVNHVNTCNQEKVITFNACLHNITLLPVSLIKDLGAFLLRLNDIETCNKICAGDPDVSVIIILLDVLRS